MKLQFSLATLFVWLAMLCASVAQADLIYLSQLRTITETATIARAVPDVKTQTFSAPDFGPFDYSGFYFGNENFPGNSAAELIGSYRSTLTSGELFAAATVRAAATADSPQKNQYGVAERTRLQQPIPGDDFPNMTYVDDFAMFISGERKTNPGFQYELIYSDPPAKAEAK